MKYFLAISTSIDTKRLKLQSINKELEKDNNLSKLCYLTMLFNTKEELKHFLYIKGIITYNELDCNLYIGYYYKSFLTLLDIPFNYDKQFFNIPSLSEYLCSKVSIDNLQNFLLKVASLISYLPESYFQLQSAINNYLYEEIYSLITNFLYDVCYSNGNLSYLMLYKIAMIVSNLDLNQRLQVTNRFIYYNEEQLHHYEHLAERAGNITELSYIERVITRQKEFELAEIERILKT